MPNYKLFSDSSCDLPAFYAQQYDIGIIPYSVSLGDEIYYKEISETQDEYLLECEYISGEFGTGTGPEFSNDPAYRHRGNFIPTLVAPEEIENLRLLPVEFKEQLVQDLKNKKF